MKLDPYITSYIIFNSKCFKDLNVKPESLKLLREHTRQNLLDVGLGNDF